MEYIVKNRWIDINGNSNCWCGYSPENHHSSIVLLMCHLWHQWWASVVIIAWFKCDGLTQLGSTSSVPNSLMLVLLCRTFTISWYQILSIQPQQGQMKNWQCHHWLRYTWKFFQFQYFHHAIPYIIILNYFPLIWWLSCNSSFAQSTCTLLPSGPPSNTLMFTCLLSEPANKWTVYMQANYRPIHCVSLWDHIVHYLFHAVNWRGLHL